jgi:hypothetical protein
MLPRCGGLGLTVRTEVQVGSLAVYYQVIPSRLLKNALSGLYRLGDGKVYALGASTGANLWAFATGDSVTFSHSIRRGGRGIHVGACCVAPQHGAGLGV